MKLLFYIIVTALILLLLRTLLAPRAQHRRPDGRTARRAPKLRNIVPCTNCHVHIPVNEAITDAQQRYFCSAQHRDAWQRRSSHKPQ